MKRKVRLIAEGIETVAELQKLTEPRDIPRSGLAARAATEWAGHGTLANDDRFGDWRKDALSERWLVKRARATVSIRDVGVIKRFFVRPGSLSGVRSAGPSLIVIGSTATRRALVAVADPGSGGASCFESGTLEH